MDSPSTPDTLKNAIAEEILTAYETTASIADKATDSESEKLISEMRYGFDLILKRLLPLAEPITNRWDKVRERFHPA